MLDSIYEGASTTLNPIIANRNLNYSKQDGHKLDMHLDGNSGFKVGSKSMASVSQQWEYTTEKNDTYRQQQIAYPNSAERPSDSRNRFSRNQPNHSFHFWANAVFSHKITTYFRSDLMYDFDYKRQHSDFDSYRLDQLSQWNDFAAHPLGDLPSVHEYESTLDVQNSYTQFLYGTKHGPSLQLVYQKTYDEKDSTGKTNLSRYLQLAAKLPVYFSHDRLDYRRGNYDGITHRDNTFFDPQMKIEYYTNHLRDHLTFDYSFTHAAPSMLYTTDTYNNSDPLNIYYNKAHLKNTRTHKMVAVFSHNNQETQLNWSLTGNYNIASHSVAMGYVYDRQTGIRTFSPANVSGNYNLSLQFKYARPLDKPKRLTFDNAIYGRMSHGVDLVSDDNGNAPAPNGVMTYWATDRMNLKYKFNKALTLGAKGYVGYGRSLSSRSGFADVHVCDFHYGLTGLLSLPLQFQLSTDLTMYSRRGYAGSGANTNDLVWNARLTRTFTRTGITLAIDGFDILGNLSNTSQLINTQGRTETYRNSLPRYIMFHLIYRLNIKPKKK